MANILENPTQENGLSDAAEYLLFYGSLMQGEPPFLGAQKNIAAEGKIKFLRRCQTAGHLYDLGSYPGFIETRVRENPPLVQAELYEILEASALALFDEYEGYYPDTHSLSFYLRKPVRLIGEETTAWCYVYNQSIEGFPLIESGCWRSYSIEKIL